MSNNLLLSNNEIQIPDDEYLVIHINKKGVITHVNEALLNISGYSEDEVIGQNISFIRHSEMPKEIFEDLRTTLKLGKSWHGIMKNRCKNDSFFWAKTCITPLFDKGAFSGYITIKTKPTKKEVETASKVYADIKNERTDYSFIRGRIIQKSLIGRSNHVFNNLTIRTRIKFLPIAAIITMIILAILGVASTDSNKESLRTVYEDRTVALVHLTIMLDNLQNSRINALAASSFNRIEIAKNRNNMNVANDKKAKAVWDEYMNTWMTEGERVLAIQFEKELKAYDVTRDTTMNLAMKGDFTRSSENAMHVAKPAYQTVHRSLTQLIELQGDIAENEYTKAKSRTTQNLYLTFLLVVIFSVISILYIRIFLLRAIVRPLSKVQYALEQMMIGDFKTSISAPNLDEIGEFIDVVKAMQVTAGYNLSEVEKARTRAEHASHAKSEFLASMSHEIRTPMNGVIGMLDVLSQTNLRKDQIETVGVIRESANALLSIINDILDYSKIEAGKVELESEPVFIESLIESICIMLESQAREKGVELSMFVDPNITSALQSDPTRLRQILINLLNNAIKFSAGLERPGQVKIRVQTVNRDDLTWLEFSISDNGIGIDEKTQHTLFAPFQQAETSTTRRFGGTGLGLTISRRLAEIMEGEITLASELGIGSTFTLYLPYVKFQSRDTELPSPIAGLPCLMIGADEGLLADVACHLVHADALVRFVKNTDDAHVNTVTQPVEAMSVWVLDAKTNDLPLAALRAAAEQNPCKDVRFVVISRGRRRHPRRDEDGLVTIDGNFLTNFKAVQLVEIAAGYADVKPKYQTQREEVQPNSIKELSREDAIRQGRMVLVAEDNEINQKVIKHQLTLLGISSEIVNDGREALKVWQTRGGDFSILLTDLHMPNVDGFQLTATIREKESQSSNKSHLKIIALTANVVEDVVDQTKLAGMNDYLSKPLQLENLKKVLDKWLPLVPEVEEKTEKKALTTKEKLVEENIITIGKGESPIDMSVLSTMIGDDPEMIAELLQDFRGNTAKLSDELQAAYEAEQYEQMKVVAHKLKSSARYVGALKLGDICDQIENLEQNVGMDQLDKSISDFIVESTAVYKYLSDQKK